MTAKPKTGKEKDVSRIQTKGYNQDYKRDIIRITKPKTGKAIMTDTEIYIKHCGKIIHNGIPRRELGNVVMDIIKEARQEGIAQERARLIKIALKYISADKLDMFKKQEKW